MPTPLPTPLHANISHWQARTDLAAAFQWTARLNMHEAVANHFSVAVNDDGSQFLMNANQVHFSRVRASELQLLDINDPDTLNRHGAPDKTAWWLHSTIHRHCPHARCIMHAHPIFSTVLASLADSALPPIDQNSAMFYNRTVIDHDFGGLALEAESTRCAALLDRPAIQIMIMGNHGVLVIGSTVAETFDRLFYFERAAENYIRALQTGRPLRILSDAIAAQTADQIEACESQGERHFAELKAILDDEGNPYAS